MQHIQLIDSNNYISEYKNNFTGSRDCNVKCLTGILNNDLTKHKYHPHIFSYSNYKNNPKL